MYFHDVLIDNRLKELFGVIGKVNNIVSDIFPEWNDLENMVKKTEGNTDLSAGSQICTDNLDNFVCRDEFSLSEIKCNLIVRKKWKKKSEIQILNIGVCFPKKENLLENRLWNRTLYWH